MRLPDRKQHAIPPELSVVVLCYRAGDRARAVATSIATALVSAGIHDYQLVLVGNYNKGDGDDATPKVVGELAASDPRIVCTATPKRGMMGWDMRSGLALADGACVAVFDGDGQLRPIDVVTAFRALHGGDYDLVIASRVHRGDGTSRRLISLVFNALFRLLFPGVGVRDVNAKPKVMTRAAYDRLELTSDDWFIDAEIMIQAHRNGFRIGEIDTEFLPLAGRASFVNLRTLLEFLRNLARFRVREFGRRRKP